MNKMARLILLAYHFLPEEGSCTDKNLRILHTLLNAGHEICVLTKGRRDDSVHSFWNHDVRVISCGTGALHHQTLSNDLSSTTSAFAAYKSHFRKAASLMIIPDSAIDWIIPTFKFFCEEKLFDQADVLVSTSSPYSSHLLAELIWRRFGIPYVLTYGDPWIYEPKRKRGKLRYLVERALERSVIQNASKTLVITEFNKNKYKELYRISDEKIDTFNIGHNGATDNPNPIDMKSPIIHMVYGGSLDPVHRNPEPFIKAISDCNNINLDIYNNDYQNLQKTINKYNKVSNINRYDQVSSDDFDAIMDEADILVLFGNRTPFQVPGKVFNYIATRRPIIYVKNNQSDIDGTEEILLQYGNSWICQNDQESIRALLATISKMNLSIAKFDKANQFIYSNTLKNVATAVESAVS